MSTLRRTPRAFYLRRWLAWSLMLSLFGGGMPLFAWGNEGHRLITEQAIALLPPSLRAYFEQHRAFLIEHSIDPDLWRIAGFQEETTRHFLDLDAYGHYPFEALPHDYQEAVGKFGREKIEKEGLLPWRTEEVYEQLVEAFRQYSRKPHRASGEEIPFFAALLSHYVSDAHVPLHAITNYNGQRTGQTGIHFRFESDLLLRYQDRLSLQPAAIYPVSNPRDFVFDLLLKSYLQAEPVLKADRIAAGKSRDYDDRYYAAFFPLAFPILEKQMNDSITAVASVIAAAWEKAGHPDLHDRTTPAPQKRSRKNAKSGNSTPS
ncbi:MAG: zinc dependent phospholipase C family protein [Terriglobia bacterium]